MAAATSIEIKRAAAAEEQARTLAEINARLKRIEVTLNELMQPVTTTKGRNAPQP